MSSKVSMVLALRSLIKNEAVGVEGIEPSATSLSVKCSANELHTQNFYTGVRTAFFPDIILRPPPLHFGLLVMPVKSAPGTFDPFHYAHKILFIMFMPYLRGQYFWYFPFSVNNQQISQNCLFDIFPLLSFRTKKFFYKLFVICRHSRSPSCF